MTEKHYKYITIIILVSLLVAYVSWLKGYTVMIDSCIPDTINQICK